MAKHGRGQRVQGGHNENAQIGRKLLAVVKRGWGRSLILFAAILTTFVVMSAQGLSPRVWGSLLDVNLSHLASPRANANQLINIFKERSAVVVVKIHNQEVDMVVGMLTLQPT